MSLSTGEVAATNDVERGDRFAKSSVVEYLNGRPDECGNSARPRFYLGTSTALEYKGAFVRRDRDGNFDGVQHKFITTSTGSAKQRYHYRDGEPRSDWQNRDDIRRMSQNIRNHRGGSSGSGYSINGPQSHNYRHIVSTDPEYQGGPKYDVGDIAENIIAFAVTAAWPGIGIPLTAAVIENQARTGDDNDAGSYLRYDYEFGNHFGGQKHDATLISEFDAEAGSSTDGGFDIEVHSEVTAWRKPDQCPKSSEYSQRPDSGVRVVCNDPDFSSSQSTQIDPAEIDDPALEEFADGRTLYRYQPEVELLPATMTPVGNLDLDRARTADDRYDATDVHNFYVTVNLEDGVVYIRDPRGNVIGEERINVGDEIFVGVPFDTNADGDPRSDAILILGPESAFAGLVVYDLDDRRSYAYGSVGDDRSVVVADVQTSLPGFDSNHAGTLVGAESDTVLGNFIVEFERGPLGTSVELFDYSTRIDVSDETGSLGQYLTEYLADYGREYVYDYTEYLDYYQEYIDGYR